MRGGEFDFCGGFLYFLFELIIEKEEEKYVSVLL